MNRTIIGLIGLVVAVVTAVSLFNNFKALNEMHSGSQLLTTDEMVGTWHDPGAPQNSAITFTNKSTGHGDYGGKVDDLLGVHDKPINYLFEHGSLEDYTAGQILLSVYTGRMAKPDASSAVALKVLDHNTLLLTVLPERPPLRTAPPLFAASQPLKLVRVTP